MSCRRLLNIRGEQLQGRLTNGMTIVRPREGLVWMYHALLRLRCRAVLIPKRGNGEITRLVVGWCPQRRFVPQIIICFCFSSVLFGWPFAKLISFDPFTVKFAVCLMPENCPMNHFRRVYFAKRSACDSQFGVLLRAQFYGEYLCVHAGWANMFLSHTS